MPFILESPGELLSLTALARFYAALPVLSRTLSNVLLQSPKFLLGMQGKALELLIGRQRIETPAAIQRLPDFVSRPMAGTESQQNYRSADQTRCYQCTQRDRH